jgi:hypothetical protein
VQDKIDEKVFNLAAVRTRRLISRFAMVLLNLSSAFLVVAALSFIIGFLGTVILWGLYLILVLATVGLYLLAGGSVPDNDFVWLMTFAPWLVGFSAVTGLGGYLLNRFGDSSWMRGRVGKGRLVFFVIVGIVAIISTIAGANQ